jgi:hypothetical protein
MNDFVRARDSRAGQLYTDKHYGFVMFLLFVKRWGKFAALGLLLLVFYVKGSA